MSGEKKRDLYSENLKETEAFVREQEKKAWRSLSGNEPIRFRDDNPDAEKIDYSVLLHDNDVIAGAIAMIFGFLVAFIGLKLKLNTTWRMVICLTAATFSTAGAKAIENAINALGYKEVREIQEYNRSKGKAE